MKGMQYHIFTDHGQHADKGLQQYARCFSPTIDCFPCPSGFGLGGVQLDLLPVAVKSGH